MAKEWIKAKFMDVKVGEEFREFKGDYAHLHYRKMDLRPIDPGRTDGDGMSFNTVSVDEVGHLNTLAVGMMHYFHPTAEVLVLREVEKAVLPKDLDIDTVLLFLATHGVKRVERVYKALNDGDGVPVQCWHWELTETFGAVTRICPDYT